MPVADTASSSSSDRDTASMEERFVDTFDDEFGNDKACSTFLQGLGEEPFA